MAKLKAKTKYRIDYPDPVELQDELEDMVPDIVRGVYTDLTGWQDVKPTMEDVMLEMARRLAGQELNEMHDGLEAFIRAQDKPRSKLDRAQEAADKLWSSRPGLSVREMAKLLSKRSLGNAEYLRQNLKKPSKS